MLKETVLRNGNEKPSKRVAFLAEFFVTVRLLKQVPRKLEFPPRNLMLREGKG